MSQVNSWLGNNRQVIKFLDQISVNSLIKFLLFKIRRMIDRDSRHVWTRLRARISCHPAKSFTSFGKCLSSKDYRGNEIQPGDFIIWPPSSSIDAESQWISPGRIQAIPIIQSLDFKLDLISWLTFFLTIRTYNTRRFFPHLKWQSTKRSYAPKCS